MSERIPLVLQNDEPVYWLEQDVNGIWRFVDNHTDEDIGINEQVMPHYSWFDWAASWMDDHTQTGDEGYMMTTEAEDGSGIPGGN